MAEKGYAERSTSTSIGSGGRSSPTPMRAAGGRRFAWSRVPRYGANMPRGYMEGPAAEEAEARAELAERGEVPVAETRAAVVGSTDDEPEPHFLGWVGEVDPDELFASGSAWGIKVVRRAG
jgi:hypothetical protein